MAAQPLPPIERNTHGWIGTETVKSRLGDFARVYQDPLDLMEHLDELGVRIVN